MKNVQVNSSTKSFEVTISAAVIRSSYQRQLQKAAESIEIKGFRKGKAPLELVEKQLDQSKIYSYVLNEVIPPAYLEGLKKDNLVPLSEPRITPIVMEEGKDWKFKVEIAVKPEFELGDYKKTVKKALKEHSQLHQHEDKPESDKDQGDNRGSKQDHLLPVIFDALLKEVKFEVSPLLVEDERKNALSRLINQLSSLKLTLADYLKSIKKTEEELIKEYEETAKTNLRLEFIIQAIVEDLKPEVTNEEIAKLKPGQGQEDYARYLVGKSKALDFLTRL